LPQEFNVSKRDAIEERYKKRIRISTARGKIAAMKFHDDILCNLMMMGL